MEQEVEQKNIVDGADVLGQLPADAGNRQHLIAGLLELWDQPSVDQRAFSCSRLSVEQHQAFGNDQRQQIPRLALTSEEAILLRIGKGPRSDIAVSNGTGHAYAPMLW